MNLKERILNTADKTKAEYKESELKRQGYCQTSKTSSKELAPREYIRRTHQGTASSFEGPETITLIWLEQA